MLQNAVQNGDHRSELDACQFRKHSRVVSFDLGCEIQRIFEFVSCGGQFCKHFLSAFLAGHRSTFSGGEDAKIDVLTVAGCSPRIREGKNPKWAVSDKDEGQLA